MDADEVLEILENLVQPNRLSPLDRLVFQRSWLGQTYHEMAKDVGYDSNYMKEVGFRLWNDLSDILGTRVTKKNLRLVFQQLLFQPLHTPEQADKEAEPQTANDRHETNHDLEDSIPVKLAKLATPPANPEPEFSTLPAYPPETLDQLTQLTNQRYFNQYLEVHWQRWIKMALPLSLILCELDHFPFYERVEEYPIGDAWLQQIGKTFESCGRHGAEIIARYGGITFAALISRLDVVIVAQMAENFRQSVKTLTIRQNPIQFHPLPNWAITVSIGIASLAPDPDSTPDELMTAAQKALLESKQQGGDRVTIYSA